MATNTAWSTKPSSCTEYSSTFTWVIKALHIWKVRHFHIVAPQDDLTEGMVSNECNCSHQAICPAALRVIESLRLEKTLKIIKSNCKPCTIKSSRRRIQLKQEGGYNYETEGFSRTHLKCRRSTLCWDAYKQLLPKKKHLICTLNIHCSAL